MLGWDTTIPSLYCEGVGSTLALPASPSESLRGYRGLALARVPIVKYLYLGCILQKATEDFPLPRGGPLGGSGPRVRFARGTILDL